MLKKYKLGQFLCKQNSSITVKAVADRLSNQTENEERFIY